MSDKQILQVLMAIHEGCETSDAASAMTGLSVATCSAYLSVLTADGLVRRRKQRRIRFHRQGSSSYLYAPVRPA